MWDVLKLQHKRGLYVYFTRLYKLNCVKYPECRSNLSENINEISFHRADFPIPNGMGDILSLYVVYIVGKATRSEKLYPTKHISF